MEDIRILVADDHSVVRYGLTTILNSVANITVVAEASSGADAFELYKAQRPDICFLDITMPDLDGIETCKSILEFDPNAKVIIMTIHLSKDYLNKVLAAGAHGYMLKNSSKQEILENIQKVMDGERVFSKAVSELMAKSFMDTHDSGNIGNLLTKREKEILRYITDGQTNQAIAEQLFISPRTVETHRANLMQKLQVKNTAALVRKVLRENIL
ncbi:MAG: response regulator transcription factor [Balneolia bacterium]|nr:response regulator transcription factor [Balneolia bacterium]